MRKFLKDLFTLRTVYIDRGRGRWAIRKRLHPLTRGILLAIFALAVWGGVVRFRADEIHDAGAEIKQAKIIELRPVAVNPPKANANQEQKLASKIIEPKPKPVLIPLKNNNQTKSKNTSKIILPSEADPKTDRIIAPKAQEKTKNSDKYRILVNKSSHTLSLLKGDKLVKSYSVATGKNTGDKERVGDNRTPVGKFKIVSIENASSWSHDFRDGKGKIAGAYGPWFLRLDAKGWRGIGIHGTHDPNSRGTNATEGCIRLSNEDIAELKENYAYRNMPVEIREN